jgi:GT2 family glycosyltransferase
MSVYSDISICIVTYKANDKIYRCLKNIYKINKIFILDNSQDFNLKKKIKKKYPKIKFFLSKKNLGYGVGNNYLLRKISTKYVLILNPDVDIKLASIKKLYIEAEMQKNNLALICATYNHENKVNFNENLFEVSKTAFLAPLINMKEFRKINFFDKNIFMYYEDWDVCYKFIKNNKRVLLHAKAKAKHISGKSSNAENYNRLRNFHYGWATFYFYKKHYGLILGIFMSFFIIAKSFLQFIYYLIINNKALIQNKLMLICGILKSFREKKDFFRGEY